MSTEQNKSIVRRWIEIGWNQGNLAVADEIYAPNFVQHDLPVGDDREALKNFVGEFRTGLPDLHVAVDDLIAEEDKVVGRFGLTGTQRGVFMGIPATGKTASMSATVIFRFANSKIVEAWVNFDALGMMQQLGAIPAMSA